MNRPLLYLLTLATLFAAGGASCRGLRRQYVEPTPVAFAGPPSLQDVIRVVNDNSGRIRQLQTQSAVVSAQGIPALRANIVLERPLRFRMRAELMGLTGPEMDLGSNEELFWVWIKRNDPPAIYYARHDQFQQSAARQIIPVEPQWLIEALGVVYLDPYGRHEGPISQGAGRAEIRSRLPSPDGELTKVTVIHDSYGWVLEQHVYDPRGQLLASARASNHRYYPVEGVSLPSRVEVQLPPAQLSFQIDVSGYAINQLYGDPAQLWALPQIEGHPLVDIADPRFQPPGAAPPSPPSQYGPSYSTYGEPRTSLMPRYRGYTDSR